MYNSNSTNNVRYHAELLSVQLNVSLHVCHVAATWIRPVISRAPESSAVALPACILRGKTTESEEVIIVKVPIKLPLESRCGWQGIREGGVRMCGPLADLRQDAGARWAVPTSVPRFHQVAGALGEVLKLSKVLAGS